MRCVDVAAIQISLSYVNWIKADQLIVQNKSNDSEIKHIRSNVDIQYQLPWPTNQSEIILDFRHSHFANWANNWKSFNQHFQVGFRSKVLKFRWNMASPLGNRNRFMSNVAFLDDSLSTPPMFTRTLSTGFVSRTYYLCTVDLWICDDKCCGRVWISKFD